jgi:hypothetical protein
VSAFEPTERLIRPVGRDGATRTYIVRCEPTLERYDLTDPSSIRPHWRLEARERGESRENVAAGFRVTVVGVGDRCAVVTELFAELPAYRERGLGEALIELSAELTTRRILSSSNSPSHEWLRGEYRTPDAEKVWQRLRAAGRARYVRAVHRWLHRAA